MHSNNNLYKNNKKKTIQQTETEGQSCDIKKFNYQNANMYS